MSNLNAAIGCAQFEKFQKNINIKNKIHNYYSKKFNKISGINLLKTPGYSYNNKWLNIVKFDNSINKIDIKKIYNSFKKHKIEVRKMDVNISSFILEVLSLSSAIITPFNLD